MRGSRRDLPDTKNSRKIMTRTLLPKKNNGSGLFYGEGSCGAHAYKFFAERRLQLLRCI
jgi:hypothetical protein